MKTDILIVGSGCSGLYCALNLPEDKNIMVISKSKFIESDSYLAQGGMCVLKSEDDYESYFNDTMKAGHYENDERSVEIMIRSSVEVIRDLLDYGTVFATDSEGRLAYTKEGGHSTNRIVYHDDTTGKEVTASLLAQVRNRTNVKMYQYTTLVDIIERDNRCYGAVIRHEDGSLEGIAASYVVLATGGVGGLYANSTNYKHLTGDSLAIALKHNIRVRNLNYVQIHPTTFYTGKKEERCFLMSESLRGEGAKLYNKDMERFVDELLPRDILTARIRSQMEADGTDHVWEDLRTIPPDELKSHFFNIVEHCRYNGYDVTKECIPVVPAQHYFMGGIDVNYESRTSMDNLYAVGETACNRVHGKNRLASNSLLESLVFAKRAAKEMSASEFEDTGDTCNDILKTTDMSVYSDAQALEAKYRALVLAEIKKEAKRGK